MCDKDCTSCMNDDSEHFFQQFTQNFWARVLKIIHDLENGTECRSRYISRHSVKTIEETQNWSFTAINIPEM